MDTNSLPKGGVGFRMDGISGFRMKLDSLIRYGSFSSLQNNRELIIDIFEGLKDEIRHYGKIPSMLRRRAYYRFISSPNTTKDDERRFKQILDNYK